MRRRVAIALVLAAGNAVALGASGCDAFGSATADEAPGPGPDSSTDGTTNANDGAGPGAEDAANGGDTGGGKEGGLDGGARFLPRCALDAGGAWFCEPFVSLGNDWTKDEQGDGGAKIAASTNATSPPTLLRIDAPPNSRAWVNRATSSPATSITCTFDVTTVKTSSAGLVLSEVMLKGTGGTAGDWFYRINISTEDGAGWLLVGAGTTANVGALPDVSVPIATLPSLATTAMLKLRIGANATVEAQLGAVKASSLVLELGALSGTTQATFGLGAFAYPAQNAPPWAIEMDDARCVLE